MKYILPILVFLSSLTNAQEISCEVVLNTDMLESNTKNSDPGVFAEMQRAIEGFMNNQKWTNDIYAEHERIKCQLTINLMRSPSQNVFSGNAVFQTLRPVYGTDYQSVTFQFIDQNFEFSFQPQERQMVFNEQGYTNELTSILAFYSLMALAVDYDSFAKMGGDPFVQRALNVANLAPERNLGWTKEIGKRSRYWLVENLQNQQLRGFREGFYTYHRNVLDEFPKDPTAARAKVLNFLEVIQNIVLLRSNWLLLNTFFDAKSDEFVKVFSQGSDEEKRKAFLLLSNLDPDKTEKYREIVL